MRNLFILLVIVSFFSGCAHVVSESLRDRVDVSISPSGLIADPESYRGSIVVLGGDIVKTENKKDGTYVEVLQKDLDSRGRPRRPSDRSAGRFLILHDGYLDPAIYEKGKMVTVAGEVIGSRSLPLGEIEYSYPLIKSEELYLIRPGYGVPVYFGVGFGATIN